MSSFAYLFISVKFSYLTKCRDKKYDKKCSWNLEVKTIMPKSWIHMFWVMIWFGLKKTGLINIQGWDASNWAPCGKWIYDIIQSQNMVLLMSCTSAKSEDSIPCLKSKLLKFSFIFIPDLPKSNSNKSCAHGQHDTIKYHILMHQHILVHRPCRFDRYNFFQRF